MDKKTKFNIFYFIIAFIEAMLIGIGGILPGISGGVLCVIFGFYTPLVESLADPKHKLVKNLKYLIPLILGSAFGYVFFAGLLSDFMDTNSTLAVCIFIGLIIGTLPQMWQDAKKEKRTTVSWVSLIISIILFLTFFMYLKFGAQISITPNAFWYFFCGVIWGISMIVPGLSSSSTLMFLGLYHPMIKSVKNLDVSALIPIAIGVILAIVLLSKLVANLYSRHHSVVSHVIIGIVVATTIPILPYEFNSKIEFILSVLCIVVGILAAYLIGIICPKIAAMVEKEN